MTVPAHTNTTTAAEVLARALYEEQRAIIPADEPLIALVGVPWDQAPTLVREHWTQTVMPMAEALAAAGLLADPTTRTEVEWGVACPLDDDVIPTADPDWSVRHHDRNCGPGHRLVRRTVTDWTPVEEGDR